MGNVFEKPGDNRIDDSSSDKVVPSMKVANGLRLYDTVSRQTKIQI